MKKALSVFLAGAFGAAALCGMVACGDNDNYDDSVYDKEAKPFDGADVTYLLNGKTDKEDELDRISDTLFGVFLEDINYASYALTSNLVANGSFDAVTKATNHGWSASKATLLVENTDGIFKDTDYASVNPNYAKVTAQADGYVYNTGFDAVPMAVTKDTDYIFSAFIKSPDAVKMTVSVTDGTTDYAETDINLLADSSWVKYTRTLKATESASENLTLRLTFDRAATVYLDGVSLDTADSTVENKIKNYLYEAIADLSPKFIRFPGGCVIEGKDQNSAYDWKNSIGAVAMNDGTDKVPAFSYKVNTDGTTKEGKATYGEAVTRKHNADIWTGGWYYDMEYTLGFYEYFLLCESVGASAVPVVSCGLSDQGGLKVTSPYIYDGRHGNKVQDYIQDAKDLIAFAKGSVNSSDSNEAYWAQVRTNMGHPEPFDMQYIGIGNEQFGKIYYDCYEQFLEAFKADDNDLYRSVKPIVGNAMTFNDCENPTARPAKKGMAQGFAEKYVNAGKIDAVSEYGVHDQHYYMNYADFFSNAHLYDSYNNAWQDDYYEVFVGEYSANSVSSGGASYSTNSEWANSWITALSEAAMMTCYERNGDKVVLAAYAPMFAPIQDAGRQWKVDMMYFTNTDLVRSTNYYVQQLFMQNQGKYKLSYSDVEYADGFETTCPLVGVGTAGTASSAKNIDKLYYVASMDENGDLLLKIVNASGEAVKLNVQIADANVRKLAKVTTLQNDDYKAMNTLDATQISPESYTIGGWEGDTLGYEAKPYSVTCIRVFTK